MFHFAKKSPFRMFEQSLRLGTESELLDSTAIAVDCVRMSSLDFAMRTLLPGVRTLLNSPARSVSDSMFA
jgi:hypothetical protein